MIAVVYPVVIVAAVGILSGFLLSIADKFMAVPTDERVGAVREELPGANCGACGFAGCDEYADKLVNEGVATNLCTPGGAQVAEKVSAILGVSADAVLPMTAIVCCAGVRDCTEYIMDYQGPQSCEGCNYFYQGRGSCSHACLGYGDCVMVCQYGAITIKDGVAVVDKALCTGCGMCAKRCPNDLIKIVPASSEVFVACSSTDRGAFVRKVCKAGCIGCKMCEKACEFDAVHIVDNLASIDPEKCTACGACVAKCPTKVIHVDTCSVRVNVGAEPDSLT